MKQINVISPIYKNQAINFNGFVVKFNMEGKGVVSFEDSQTENVDKIFEVHPNIYKGDKLPIIMEQKENKSAKTEIIDNTEFEMLKESNKKLALENANLKKEKEELKKEISSLMQEKKTDIESEVKEDIAEKKENENSFEEASIKKDLSKKTVSQLKELLNTEDFLPFEEEWKCLTKKDEIITFILKKVKD